MSRQEGTGDCTRRGIGIATRLQLRVSRAAPSILHGLKAQLTYDKKEPACIRCVEWVALASPGAFLFRRFARAAPARKF
jgi:hypothetical protein